MSTFFARQPILDAAQKLYGYELLFRPNPDATTSGISPQFDGDRATASVLESLYVRGIDKVTGNKMAFVNFTEGLLHRGLALKYPKDYLVVEVLESAVLDDKLYEALVELQREGYSLALDDYIFKDGHERFLRLMDIVKVEVNDSATAERNIAAVRTRINPKKCKILAEKVEDKETFEKARALGCSLFQGYYFAYPDIVVDHTLGPLRMNHLRLIAEVTKPTVDFQTISNIIKQDVGLSYKTLRLVNSAYFGLSQKINNIHQAVVFLGTNELKKWISFTSLTNITEGKPTELMAMSLTRASFCESVAEATGRRRDAESFFLAGMFSLLYVMMEMRMESALSYFLLAELKAYCLANGLSTQGGKQAVTERIAHYMATGEKLPPAKMKTKTVRREEITADSIIEENIKCSEMHRTFFKEAIGPGFTFTVAFQAWLKENHGKSFGQAAEAYHRIMEEKKKTKTVISGQFEYNTYIRAFFEDNPGEKREVAIRCWKYKRNLPGHNRYEKEDLAKSRI